MSRKWLEPENSLQKSGLFVMMGSLFSATSATGFFFSGLSLHTAGVLSVVCGLVGGGLFAWKRAPTYVGAISGVIAAVGGMVLTYYWTLGREEVWSLETAISWIIGAMPGAMLFQFWAENASEKATTGR
jgi:hypothetical protein